MTTIYLRALVDNQYLTAGEVYAAHGSAESGWSICYTKDSSVAFTHEEARELFKLTTKSEFTASVMAAMEAVDSLEAEHDKVMAELAGISNDALTSGEEPSAELAVTRTPAAELRNRAHAANRKLKSFTTELDKRKTALQAKLQQQMQAMSAKAGKLQKYVKKLTEVVHMVNLYLGRDEEIHCIRSGERAPEGTPVTIRQGVCYMDEEIALTKHDGVDFSELDVFDKWLIENEGNLSQILPEPKGIIVLQVRRSAKEYNFDRRDISAALDADSRNKENQKTYFLMKNGENLHRLWTDIDVGERLIARADELDSHFLNYDGEPYRPGSNRYYEAMESADAVSRHYMRLLLILQGIFDRTILFAPYASGKPNLLDPASLEGQVVFLRDVESVISDGRPSFREWLRGVNREMRTGQRVIGQFQDFSRDEHSRFSPRFAEGIDNSAVHTLEAGLKVRFERTDMVRKRDHWGNVNYGPAEKRASFQVHEGDDFLICIDNADIPEMDHYLRDRHNRKSYETMIPMLKSAIAFKCSEEIEERPFIDLISKKIEAGGTPCDTAKVRSLIRWWKLKQKNHRAIKSDDSVAWRAILAEYKSQSAPPAKFEEMEKLLSAQSVPGLMAAWYKGGNSIIVLRSIPDYPVFAHEETWKVRKGEIASKVKQEWVVPVKAKYLRWTQLHTTSEWENRPERPRAKLFIKPSEFSDALAAAIVHANDKGLCLLAVICKKGDESYNLKSITVEMFPDDRSVWSRDNGPERDEAYYHNAPATKFLNDPDMREWDIRRNKSEGEIPFQVMGWSGRGISMSRKSEYEYPWQDPTQGCEVIHMDAGIDQEIQKEKAIRSRHNKRAERIRNWARNAEECAHDFLHLKLETAEFDRYIAQGGDPEFFSDHMKTLKAVRIEADVDGVLMEAAKSGLTMFQLVAQTLPGVLKAGKVKPEPKTLTPDFMKLMESEWVVPSGEFVRRVRHWETDDGDDE